MQRQFSNKTIHFGRFTIIYHLLASGRLALALLRCRQCDFEYALRVCDAAAGSPIEMALALYIRAAVYIGQGFWSSARSPLQNALGILANCTDWNRNLLQCDVLTALGDTERAFGHAAEARTHYQAAIDCLQNGYASNTTTNLFHSVASCSPAQGGECGAGSVVALFNGRQARPRRPSPRRAAVPWTSPRGVVHG